MEEEPSKQSYAGCGGTCLNPSTRETEGRGLKVGGQSKQYSESLPQKQPKKFK
jgi:hypothetical protein